MAEQAVIYSQRVVIGGELRPAALVLEDGQIREVLEVDDLPQDLPARDFGDQVIMAGLIDPHVHINEPGRTEWEGFETATKAAAAGGITTVVDMPLNSSPVTTSPDAFEKKLAATHQKLFVDCGFYAGLVPGNSDQLEALLDAGVLGVKAFLCHSGIDDFPNATEQDLRAAMPILAARNKPLLVHAELVDSEGSDDHDGPDTPQNYRAYAAARPQRWELRAIELLLKLVEETGCHVHIVHLAASEALPMLRDARERGLPVTVETGPHYLYFASEEIPDGDTRYKCAPPIRDDKNRRNLLQALQNGDIDLVATDHSPSTPDLKELDSGNLLKAWGGISSLQLLLPVLWTAAKAEGATIVDVARWISSAPARLLGLQETLGTIAPGRPANLVVWDPDKEFTVDADQLHHRHKITPYEGEMLQGVVNTTFLRGEAIFDATRSPALLPAPTGHPILSTEIEKS